VVAEPSRSQIRAKPRLRGVSHKWAFFVSLVTGALLILLSPSGEARVATLIYGICIASMFGASALYHLHEWTPAARRWMRRLDHSTIFLMIAGSYTPFALLVMHGTLATVVLAVIWGGALAGIVLKLAWIDAPKWLVAAIYVALGWVAVAAFPQLLDELGVVPTALVALGGLLYTAGAVIYALKRPDPSPEVFGYHEIFHLLVIAAALVQYAVVGFYVLPQA